MISVSIHGQNIISIVTENISMADLSALYHWPQFPGRKVYYFHRIRCLPKFEGTGEGKEMMIEICKIVDDEDAIIINELNPYGKRDLESLKSFFRASGFVEYGEPDEDTMIRMPNKC